MLYGHVETYEERVDHLLRLRELQDETGGFLAFIPLAFHPENTVFERRGWTHTTGSDDLKMIAVSRLMLDNIPNVKAYWIMMGMPLAQVALHFGANDVQGTVVREQIFHAAGARTETEQKIDELVALRAGGRARSRCSATRSTTSCGGGSSRVIRLGRISYVNMAPVFYRLEAEVEEVQGVPTELNRRLLAGEIDLAPISSIEYARNADRLRLLPRLCVSSEGAVDSIQLVSRCRSSRSRSVAVTPESATSVVLTKVLLPEAEHVPLGEEARREAPDRRRGAASRLRGSDAAPRPRPAVAGAHRPADGVRGLGVPRAAARRARRARGRARRAPCASRAPSPSGSRTRRASATAIRPASSRATSRSSATASARASARASSRSSSWRARSASWTHVPELRFVRRRGRRA